jgi:hypothetical protein
VGRWGMAWGVGAIRITGVVGGLGVGGEACFAGDESF